MKTYTGVVVFRYYQTVEVDAESSDEAKRLMFEKFKLDKADGECETLDIQEVET